MENKKDPHYYSHARVDLIGLIPPGIKKILEVGCGGGMTGKALRERGFEKIVGIEINEEVAREGRPFYDQIIIGDVEKIRLPFEKEHFDCILYGDVLEHLVNPWQLLKDHQTFLKKGGTIICSIPNVRNYRILKDLIIRGKWEYTEDGILDRSHLRFFTLDSIRGMLKEAGFEIQSLIKRSSGAHWVRWIRHLLGSRLIEILVRQYIIVARKR
jgi:2-polyprenyl-3-methyl-5-hydroxy-6-metoxy-1,4-benzoquinol methylase